MKHLFSSLLIFAFATIAKAHSEHLTFMGVPIDGKEKTFVKALESKLGTKLKKGVPWKAIKYGYNMSWNNEDVQLLVVANDKKTVNAILLEFIPLPRYEPVKERFDAIVKDMKAKYGKEKKNVSIFKDKDGVSEAARFLVYSDDNKYLGMITVSMSIDQSQTTTTSGSQIGTNFGIPNTTVSIGSSSVMESSETRNIVDYKLYVNYTDESNITVKDRKSQIVF